jgi:hypothetical protein
MVAGRPKPSSVWQPPPVRPCAALCPAIAAHMHAALVRAQPRAARGLATYDCQYRELDKGFTQRGVARLWRMLVRRVGCHQPGGMQGKAVGEGGSSVRGSMPWQEQLMQRFGAQVHSQSIRVGAAPAVSMVIKACALPRLHSFNRTLSQRSGTSDSHRQPRDHATRTSLG